MKHLREKFLENSYERLMKIRSADVCKFIEKYAELCNPRNIYVNIGTPEDIEYIRKKAIEDGEEIKLKMEGHTVHFDGYYDQARDRKNTKFLLPAGVDYGKYIEWIERDEGLIEIHELMKDIMKDKILYVCFYMLGPANSEFSIPCIQLTDSAYVVHSENILYRQGYEEFLKERKKFTFFKFIHSAGELDERKTSKNIDKRRVYIDLLDNTVYSINTQYGGNSIGLKKLSLRLAIYKASKEGWLAEHMLIIGINGPKKRVTYFTGAFPSLCGKTSTAMMPDERLIGDDIAYLRSKKGKIYAVNIEKGMFGIIEGINPSDDPLIHKGLTTPGDVIFSNVLMSEDGEVYWVGSGRDCPEKGINYSGEWYKGKKDEKGKDIPPSHPNARFTISLRAFENLDPKFEDPNGVPIEGIVYGGRDSDTWVPVEEAFNWVHGIITKGACLESEPTAAVLEATSQREFNPMSNLDFLSVTIGRYIKMYLDFGKKLRKKPKIFSVNYFLRDKDGKFLNEKVDKKVWYKWMELRVNNEVDAIKTPTGYIPKYEDLKRLFKKVLNKDYKEEDYVKQFTIRIPEQLRKIERMMEIYKEIKDTPEVLFDVLQRQRRRLLKLQRKKGDYISPFELYEINVFQGTKKSFN
ncbi:MAG: phosphoenolpyruvate carboxykinase (GTP) [Thermodesulfovibrio sp.]|nr:phosphoenolpyruvate carboxykinase (GTP) [Thermodesulfovibrio sp.]